MPLSPPSQLTPSLANMFLSPPSPATRTTSDAEALPPLPPALPRAPTVLAAAVGVAPLPAAVPGSGASPHKRPASATSVPSSPSSTVSGRDDTPAPPPPLALLRSDTVSSTTAVGRGAESRRGTMIEREAMSPTSAVAAGVASVVIADGDTTGLPSATTRGAGIANTPHGAAAAAIAASSPNCPVVGTARVRRLIRRKVDPHTDDSATAAEAIPATARPSITLVPQKPRGRRRHSTAWCTARARRRVVGAALEQYFSMPFFWYALPDTLLRLWEQAPPNDALHPPAPNSYIATGPPQHGDAPPLRPGFAVPCRAVLRCAILCLFLNLNSMASSHP